METKDIKHYCIDCVHCDSIPHTDVKYHCTKHDIDINIIDETDEDIILDHDTCDDFREAMYTLTEKGILGLILDRLDIIKFEDDEFNNKLNTVWELIFEYAKKYGFYREYGDPKDKEYPKTDLTFEDIFKKEIKVVFRNIDDDILDAAWMLFCKDMKKLEYFGNV